MLSAAADKQNDYRADTIIVLLKARTCNYDEITRNYDEIRKA